MPSIPLRRPRTLEAEDESESDETLSPALSDRSSTSKRVRTNGHGPGHGHAPPSSTTHDQMEEYQPGAIIRVKLLNFVTYTSAEFFPGPSLNMVIGPNGTGKSTLVCAICLGLGWGPQVSLALVTLR